MKVVCFGSFSEAKNKRPQRSSGSYDSCSNGRIVGSVMLIHLFPVVVVSLHVC
jgi:hypothetical protein